MLRTTLIAAFLLLAGCAYSPQQITINPVVDTSGERYGDGRPVTVTVDDRRENKVLGSRGGLYKDTSIITISNDINAALVKAAQAILATQGFNVNPLPEQQPAQLTIVIEELSYDIPKQGLGNKIELKALLLAEVNYQGERYSGRYETKRQRQDVVAPSSVRNEKMINTLLSDTLARLFADAKLQAFLSNI